MAPMIFKDLTLKYKLILNLKKKKLYKSSIFHKTTKDPISTRL